MKCCDCKKGKNDIAGEWMPKPQGICNCPPGLEYLASIDQISIHDIVETGWISSAYKRYRIINNKDEVVYLAEEERPETLIVSQRHMNMKLIENSGKEVIHLHRSVRSDDGCCCFQLNKMDVSAPVGQIVGYVVEDGSWEGIGFTIENAAGGAVLRIIRPGVCFRCCGSGDVNFDVMALDGNTQVGIIQWQNWTGGFIRCDDADDFGITFPMDLDVRMKAVMIGASLLIDFMYFESGR
uniref:Phospholipid scramblase n=1 Tax=Strigamia maritima TaxID=126957 RepID=T1JP42_STRMM